MISDSLPAFFDQYKNWLLSNKWNILLTVNLIASLIILNKIKTELIIMYWSKKRPETRFYSKWLKKIEYKDIITHSKSGKKEEEAL